MTNQSKEKIEALISEYRKALEEMIIVKDLVTDEEVVILSQALDELITEYYRIIKNI